MKDSTTSEIRGAFSKIKCDSVVAIISLISFAVHLIVINNLEYQRDELLYFTLGQHPAFGYATVPPMIGWIAWLMQNIFGYSLFSVRLFPALMGGIMIFLVAAISKELGGSRYSSVLAATGFLISIFGLRTFGLFQPVHLDLLFWTVSFYLIIRYRNTYSDKYLIMFGIAAGFGFLNKYLIGLLFSLLLITIPFTSLKTVFRNKKFWFGLLIGFTIFLPNIIWQIVNGLPLIGHLSELERTQLVNLDRPSFLVDQLIMPGAAAILPVAGLIFLVFNKHAVKFRFVGIVSLLVILTLMLLKGKSYYTLGVFPLLIAAGAVFWERLLNGKISRIILIGLILIFTIPIIPIGLPVFKTDGLVKYFKRLDDKYGLDIGRRFDDGSIHSLPQDYADMLGWEELAALANKAYDIVPDKKACFIYCENYGQAGAISVIGKKYGLPEAVCFSESFRYWIPLKFDPDPTAFIYINDELGNDVNKLFRKITNIGSISNPDAREFGTTVYLCQDSAWSFNKFWAERISKLIE